MQQPLLAIEAGAVVAPVFLLGYTVGSVIFMRRVLIRAVLQPAEEHGPLVGAAVFALMSIIGFLWPVAWIAYVVWNNRNRVD